MIGPSADGVLRGEKPRATSYQLMADSLRVDTRVLTASIRVSLRGAKRRSNLRVVVRDEDGDCRAFSSPGSENGSQ